MEIQLLMQTLPVKIAIQQLHIVNLVLIQAHVKNIFFL